MGHIGVWSARATGRGRRGGPAPLEVSRGGGRRWPHTAGDAHRAGRLDAAGAEIVAELLERWPALQPEARVRLARQVLARYGSESGESGDDEAAWRTRLERLARPQQR